MVANFNTATAMIVLTTPTGNIGSKVLGVLLSTPTLAEPLRLIVRDPAKLPANLPASLEIVRGATDDPAALRRALRGADTLFWCQPDTPTAEDYLKAYDDWSRLACEAVDAAGVERVVAITGAGGEPSMPAGPATGLALIEKNLSESKAALRFLRCGSFFSNLLWQWDAVMRDGVFGYSMPGDVPSPQVATGDIARVAAGLLLDPTWTRRGSLSLLGPRDLSYNDIAAELSRRLGRPVRYEQMPADAYRELCIQGGLSPSAAQGLVDMFAYLAAGYREDPRADHTLTPTTFGQWFSESFPQAR